MTREHKMKKRGKIKIERNAESVERRTRKRMMMMIYAAVNQLNISAASAKVPSAVRTAERPAPSLRHLGPWGSADTQIQNIQMPGNFKFSRERCKEKKNKWMKNWYFYPSFHKSRGRILAERTNNKRHDTICPTLFYEWVAKRQFFSVEDSIQSRDIQEVIY